uniref:ATP synthase subunit a n=1 Tax=Cassida sp. EMHAU-15090501 TaxID=2480058 RepID=A0A3G3C764_9CUCU|nr:ATP synthase F0 subunit 6 [Cassida sp. EMHAU-15090501]
MMTNLFSSFDPSTNVFSMNWLSMFLPWMFIPFVYWFTPSRFNMVWMKLTKVLNNEIKTLTPNKESKGMSLFIISIFIMIMINNFMGLFPYIFTSTSHMAITLSMALPLWLSFMIFGWIKKTMNMFAHLVPQGTPPILMPFMVCIETISNIIRPGTLAVRLSANMIAGHLLMTLLGSVGPLIPSPMVNILIIVQILLLILEMSVSIIQAYVFMILTTLYSSEVN